MSATDAAIVLEILAAEDIAERQRAARLGDLAAIVMHTAPSAEMRTAARLHYTRWTKENG